MDDVSIAVVPRGALRATPAEDPELSVDDALAEGEANGGGDCVGPQQSIYLCDWVQPIG